MVKNGIIHPKWNGWVHLAYSEFRQDLQKSSPYLAERFRGWFTSLYGNLTQEQYFNNPLAFPLHLFPWWLTQALHLRRDEQFQIDLVRSSFSGYYFIRLIDNVMDKQSSVETKILPLLGYLHHKFQSVYFKYFEHRHPFWEYFERQWTLCAEAATRDAELSGAPQLNKNLFKTVTAKKLCAGKIPMMAVCMKNGLNRLPKEWEQLYDEMCCWHQMLNDVCGWKSDLERKTMTWFLCEGYRRSRHGEIIDYWVIREGLDWGIETLNDWMKEMKHRSSKLDCVELNRYLDFRENNLKRRHEGIQKGLQSARTLILKTHGSIFKSARISTPVR